MDIDLSRTYRLSEVARAAGVPKNTLSAWLARDQIELVKGTGDRETSGTGDPRLFSWNRAINIAIVAELNSFGIPPSAGASRLALKFSDIGGAKRAHRADGDTPSDARPAGGLYPYGETWFVVSNCGGDIVARVSDRPKQEIRHGIPATSFIAIDMVALVGRVLGRLHNGERK